MLTIRVLAAVATGVALAVAVGAADVSARAGDKTNSSTGQTKAQKPAKSAAASTRKTTQSTKHSRTRTSGIRVRKGTKHATASTTTGTRSASTTSSTRSSTTTTRRARVGKASGSRGRKFASSRRRGGGNVKYEIIKPPPPPGVVYEDEVETTSAAPLRPRRIQTIEAVPLNREGVLSFAAAHPIDAPAESAAREIGRDIGLESVRTAAAGVHTEPIVAVGGPTRVAVTREIKAADLTSSPPPPQSDWSWVSHLVVTLIGAVAAGSTAKFLFA